MANESRYISRYTGRQIDHAYETVKEITSTDEGKVVGVDANGNLKATNIEEENIMPQRLSILSPLGSNVPNERIVLATYDTNSTEASKITLNDFSARIRPTIITTAGATVPADAQVGQYIFLEKASNNNNDNDNNNG